MSCCVHTTPRLRRFTCPVFAPSSRYSSSRSPSPPWLVLMLPAPATAATIRTATPANSRLSRISTNKLRQGLGDLAQLVDLHRRFRRLDLASQCLLAILWPPTDPLDPELELVQPGHARDLESPLHELFGTAGPSEPGLSDPLLQIEVGEHVGRHVRQVLLAAFAPAREPDVIAPIRRRV